MVLWICEQFAKIFIKLLGDEAFNTFKGWFNKNNPQSSDTAPFDLAGSGDTLLNC